MGRLKEAELERVETKRVENLRQIGWIRAYQECLREARLVRRVVFKEAQDADVPVGSNHCFYFSRCEDTVN